MFPPRLHLITNDEVLAGPLFLQHAAAIIECCGADLALHVRGHATDGATLFALAERLRALCDMTDAIVIVNDRIDIAMGAGTPGVQLGVRSLPIAAARRLGGVDMRIGYSAHDADEAAFAAADGADWILMGTIYDSPSHPGGRPAGLDALRDCAARAGVPVIAIGGITPERVAQVCATGAHGVAMLGGIWNARDPAVAVASFRDAVRNAWKRKGAGK